MDKVSEVLKVRVSEKTKNILMDIAAERQIKISQVVREAILNELNKSA